MKLVLIGAALAALSLSAGAHTSQSHADSPHPHNPSALQQKGAPHPGVHPVGQHKHEDHGKATQAAVAKHAATSCDTLAHHFVGAANHQTFLKECNNSHHHVLTHVKPHPDAKKT